MSAFALAITTWIVLVYSDSGSAFQSQINHPEHKSPYNVHSDNDGLSHRNLLKIDIPYMNQPHKSVLKRMQCIDSLSTTNQVSFKQVH